MQTATSLSTYPLSIRPFIDPKSVEAETPTKIEVKFAKDIKKENLKAQIIYEEDDVPPVPKCGICFESLMDRKIYVYDCQHTYCLECSNNFSIKHDQTTIKACPACRFPEKNMTAKTPFDNRCETIPDLLKAFNIFASIHELEQRLPVQHPLIEGEWMSLENLVYNSFPQLLSSQTDTHLESRQTDIHPGQSHRMHDSSGNIENKEEIPDLSSLSLCEKNNTATIRAERQFKLPHSQPEATTLDTHPIASASLEQPAARSSIAPKIVVLCQEEDIEKVIRSPLLSGIKASKQQYLIYPMDKNGASDEGEKMALMQFAKNNYITFMYFTNSLCKEFKDRSSGRKALIDDFIHENRTAGKLKRQMYKNIVPVRSSGVNRQSLPLILSIVRGIAEDDSSAQKITTDYIHETLGRPIDVKSPSAPRSLPKK